MLIGFSVEFVNVIYEKAIFFSPNGHSRATVEDCGVLEERVCSEE